MKKYEISVSAVLQEFKHRSLNPDWQHEVKQGKLKLWRINNNLISELSIDSDDDESIPGEIIIKGRTMYANTSSPQDIANDLIEESKLDKISSQIGNKDWITTVEAEEKYGLPKGSVRRDIHRGKFQEYELKKVGRDWIVNIVAIDKRYCKKAK